MTAPLLEARGLAKRFGGLQAVNDLSLEVRPGEILGVIGPNGAGKTTLLNLLSGVYRPDRGRILMSGRDVTAWPPERRCRLGLGRAFQIARPFPEMTVLENVRVGATFGAGLRLERAHEEAERVLELTGLAAKADEPAHSLSLLEDKRLELARAIATGPTVLLLDEVMAGLRPTEGRQAVELVRRVRDTGVAVLFIEHVMPVVRDLADRVVVMEHGERIAEGAYADVTRDPAVVEAYLGRDDEDDDRASEAAA